jgi:cytochrome c peroxidase
MRGALSLLTVLLLAAISARAADAPAPEELRTALERIDASFLSFRDEPAPKPGEIELGRELFFDPRLSRARALSCASCHQPGLAWTDGLPRALGKDQKPTLRNTPSLLGVAGHAPFFRDGRAPTLEAQALMPIQDPTEMDFTLPELVERLEGVPGYARQFRAVYGAGASPERVAAAIAAFERTIEPARDSPFDRFRRGDAPLPAPAARGLVLFTGKARCVLCHPGSDFTDNIFHNVGERRVPGDDDPGRYAVAPVDYAFRAFKTPSLRDVALTPPYLHDGSIPDLRAAVDFYDRAGDEEDGRDRLLRPLGLSEREKRDLVAFLEALTSTPAEVKAPLLPPDDDPEAPRAGLSPEVAGVASAAERGEAEALRARARELELAARRLRLEKAPAERSSSCLGEIERRARRLGYGPAAADAAGRARALALAWTRCAAELGEAGAPEAADLPGAEAAAARAAELLGAPTPPDADAARCRARFSPDSFLADLRAGRFDADLSEELVAANFDDLARWRGYAALRTDDRRGCDALKGFTRTYNGLQVDAGASCREWADSVRFARALMLRAPDFPAACRALMRDGYTAMSDADIEGLCALIAKDVDEPARLCAELGGRWLPAERGASCEAEFARYARGDGGSCAGFTSGPEILSERCEGLLAYRRALAGGGARACGSSELCRALAGDAEGPQTRVGERLSSRACGTVARAARSTRRSDLDLARGELDAAGAGVAAAESVRPAGDRAAAARIDAEAERVARLAQRVSAELAGLPADLAADAAAPAPESGP